MMAHVKLEFTLIAFLLVGLPSRALAQASTGLTVTSSAFAAGAPIPVGYTCKSPNVETPPLSWQGVPKDAATLVLIVKDPDAPHGPFIHWVVYNLPASLGRLDANVPASEKLADGGLQGVNSLGRIGYKGPCPPPGDAPHHYHFDLTALDTTLNLKPGATAEQVEEAMRGHVKATGELVGTFAR